MLGLLCPQIVAADKAVWAKLLEEGVKPRRDSDGTLPVDVGLMKALESYAVSFSLLPLPQQKKSAPVAAAPKPKAAVKTTVFQKPSKGKASQRVPTKDRGSISDHPGRWRRQDS